MLQVFRIIYLLVDACHLKYHEVEHTFLYPHVFYSLFGYFYSFDLMFLDIKSPKMNGFELYD